MSAEYITVYNILYKHHVIIPKDYILVVVPIFKKSAILASAEPEIEGAKAVITLKTQDRIVTDTPLSEIAKFLGAPIMGEHQTIIDDPVAPEMPKVQPVVLMPEADGKH